MLDSCYVELEKCKVKAIFLSNPNDIQSECWQKMPFRIDNKEFYATEYYFQDYKIAGANVEYGSLLQFLQTKEYIDVAIDYPGSINREEVVVFKPCFSVSGSS